MSLFTWQDLVRFALRQTRLRMRGETRSDLRSARDLALAFVAGKRVDEIVALGEEIYDEEMADRVWSGTRALAERHLADGQRVWLVTATPVELATIIARRLGLTGALGTVAESVDGTYTGYLVGNVLHGEDKAQAVRGLAAREGLDLRALLRLLRLDQRPADADGRGPPRRGQPGLGAAGGSQAARLVDPRLPDRPQGRAGRYPRRTRGGDGGRCRRGRDGDPA